MGLFSAFMLKTHLNYIDVQPKIFSKHFFDQIQANASINFLLDLYFLYHATKYDQVLDFPIYFEKRLHGEAKSDEILKTKYKLSKKR